VPAKIFQAPVDAADLPDPLGRSRRRNEVFRPTAATSRSARIVCIFHRLHDGLAVRQWAGQVPYVLVLERLDGDKACQVSGMAIITASMSLRAMSSR